MIALINTALVLVVACMFGAAYWAVARYARNPKPAKGWQPKRRTR